MPRWGKLLVVFGGVIGGIAGGVVLRELTAYDQAGIWAAIGLPAFVALFGFLWIADDWKDAITAALIVSYLSLLASAFATAVFGDNPIVIEGGGKIIFDSFTGLISVVMVAYFGQAAVQAGATAYLGAHANVAPGAVPALPPQNPIPK